LVERVLSQVRCREALVWWRRSFWHWPVAVRGLVLALLVSLSLAVVGVGTGLWSPFELPTLPLRDWASSVLQAWGRLQPLPKSMTGWWSLPGASTWLLGIGLFCSLVYFLVVGIGSIFLQLLGPERPSHIVRNA